MELRVKHGSLLWFGKVLLSGVLAFIALWVICIIYYNVPPHYKSPSAATDYVWKPHAFHCTMREGILSSGHINNEGYANTFDYSKDMPIDVLIMGSSHMEAFQVSDDESTSSLLNNMLGDKTVYNIGLSNHTFPICISNLQSSIEYYHPSNYIIIETFSLNFSEQDLKSLLNDSYPGLKDRSGGLEGLLQIDPYLRLLYKQVQGYLATVNNSDDTSDNIATSTDSSLLSALLSQMADTVASSGARLIIAYHPGTALNKDGSITYSTTQAEENAFADLCEENGVLFLDMRDRFQKEYDENHVLPYGFSNTSVGSGHLNRDGHRMMAEELYAMMREAGL